MGRMTKVMCSSCGRDVLMTTVAFEELKSRNRGRGLRGFRCESCESVVRKLEYRSSNDDMPEWKLMSLLPEGAKVRGRNRPYSGVNEFRTYRSSNPDELPPDDYGNRIDYQPHGDGNGRRRSQPYGQAKSQNQTQDSVGGDVDERSTGNVIGSCGDGQCCASPNHGACNCDGDGDGDDTGKKKAVDFPEGSGGAVAETGNGNGNGRDGAGNGNSRLRGGQERRDDGRTLYKTTCSRCFRPTKVPFRPTPARTIYCRQCMAEKGMRTL